MEEIWRKIKGYDGYYVSNFGRVRSSRTILKGDISHDGYKRVKLWCKGKQKNYSVARLVAVYFGYNVVNKPQVNHKDMNKANNCINNLEWVTDQENKAHAQKNDLYRKGSSDYKGVRYHHGRWCVRIMVRGYRKYLGAFHSEIEARDRYLQYIGGV